MKTIYVAVASKRRPKLNAVWEALSVFGPAIDSNARFDVVGIEVESGVRHTPLSREEMMCGARQRAQTLIQIASERKTGEEGKPWSYYVGLEGGLDVLRQNGQRLVFLQNWAYVTDGSERSSYGQSGAIPIPEMLARRVVDEGVELAQAIDEFAQGHNIRDRHGTWGVLSANMITRQDAFRTAVINAFAPFFNRNLYDTR